MKNIKTKKSVERLNRKIEGLVGDKLREAFGERNDKGIEKFKEMLMGVIKENEIKEDLIKKIDLNQTINKKTKFDLLFDFCMENTFKNYLPKTYSCMDENNPRTKLWKVIVPKGFKINHVYLRADSFQEAFGMGCDYICRSCLKQNNSIPKDLTIRVIYMDNKRALRVLLEKIKSSRLSIKQPTHKKEPKATLLMKNYSIEIYKDLIYAEKRDLKLLNKIGISKDSMLLGEFSVKTRLDDDEV